MKQTPTKSELEAFVDAEFTVADIALYNKWSVSKVRYWLKKHGLQASKEKGSIGAKAFKIFLKYVFPAFPIEEEKGIGYGLRLDFYIPALYTAFEVDGDPHRETIPLFHQGEEGYKKAVDRDKKKEDWCKQNNILLIRVSAALAVETRLSTESREAVANEIRDRIAKAKPTGPVFEEKKKDPPKHYNDYRERMNTLGREARKKSYRKAKALKDKLKKQYQGNALKDD